MKELSIEEKAKRYDEAIEKFDVILNLNTVKESGTIFADDVRKIFPELKESEGEKIRKSLIILLQHFCKGYRVPGLDFPVSYKDMLAYLEKQGEQKSDTNCLLSWSEIDEKMFQSLESIVEDYWAKAEQEKNEIKIREASNVSYFLKTIQKSPLCWIKCSDGLPNRDGTYLVVTDGSHNDVYDMARYDSIDGWHKASEIIYWMPIPQLNNKSIIEQKPIEWSEEDENINECIQWTLIDKQVKEKEPNKYNREIDWLKSLKDRYSWKPSDEQIDAIGHICDGNYNVDLDILDSIYRDFKKLREG